MIKSKTLLISAAGFLLSALSLSAQQLLYPQGNGGGDLGGSTTQPIGFHGVPSTPERSGIAEKALTLGIASGTITLSGTPRALAYASGTLSLPVLPSNGESVTVNSGTITFVSALSGTSAQVLIASDPADTLENLVALLDNTNANGQQNGVTYINTGSAANASVTASLGPLGGSMVLTSATSGTIGNGITTTSSFASGSNAWGGSTLAGGAAGWQCVIGSSTYNAVAALTGTLPNQFLVSGSAGTATDLAAAINATSGLGGIDYSSTTISSTQVIATSTNNVVTLTAIFGGTAANLIGTSGTDAAVSYSGTSLASGTNYSDTNSMSNLLQEIRATLVQKGLMKGSN